MRQVRSPARTHHFAIIVSRVAAIGVGDIGLRYHFRRQVAARFPFSFNLFIVCFAAHTLTVAAAVLFTFAL